MDEHTLEIIFVNSFSSKSLILLSLLINRLLLSEKKKINSYHFSLLQEKNPTNVRGKGAHGSLRGLMN